jgi:hypothetical protein
LACYRILVLQEFGIPETHDAKALGLEERVSLGIIFSLFSVLTAVQFNNELCFNTNEISDVTTNRILPLELVPSEPTISYHPPELLFRFGGDVPHRARVHTQLCALLAFFQCSFCDHDPLTLTLSP